MNCGDGFDPDIEDYEREQARLDPSERVSWEEWLNKESDRMSAFDEMAEEALADYRAGRTTPL